MSDRFTIVPIEGEALRVLLPLLRKAQDTGGLVIIHARGCAWPDTHPRLEAGIVSKRAAEKIRKALEADAPKTSTDTP